MMMNPYIRYKTHKIGEILNELFNINSGLLKETDLPNIKDRKSTM